MANAQTPKFDRSLAMELWIWIVVVFLFILDQGTKLWIIHHVHMMEHLTVFKLGNFGFDIVHVQNQGAAFGIFHGQSAMFRLIFFGIVTLVCLYLIIYWLGTTVKSEKMQRWGLALIMGGAFGNLIDRIRFGYVTDFLDVYYARHHWPAFNVADSAICVGVGLIVLRMLLNSKKPA